MVHGSVHILLFIAWHFVDNLCTSQERDKYFGTFYVHVGLMVRELASLEKEERGKKMTILDFFKFVFLASLKLS